MATEQEKLDLVREGIAAWNQNDWTRMEALAAPGIVIQAPEGWPERGEFSGWEAVRSQWERLKEPWAEERIEPLELTSVGDRVMVHNRWSGHGEGSGLVFDLETWVVYVVRGQCFARMEFYLDEASAQRSLELGNKG